jgi:hypothetical protein
MLSFYSSSRIDANRLKHRPKAPTTLSAAASATLIYRAKNRRRVGGINKTDLVQSLKNSYVHTAVGELDSNDSKAELEAESKAESDSDHQPQLKARRNAYSKEKKLAVITYLELTDMLNLKAKGDSNAS